MRAVLLILSTAFALVAVSTGFAATDRQTARPTVRIVQQSPLVVAGERFRPVERIVIRVTTPSKTHTRATRTTRRGTFLARFAAVDGTSHRCDGGFSVMVTNATGLVAKSRMPQTLCPPGMGPLGGPMP